MLVKIFLEVFMRKLRKPIGFTVMFAVLLAGALAFIGCEGPQGPMGPQGPQGPQGPGWTGRPITVDPETFNWDEEWDVIIVGAGTAGMHAALALLHFDYEEDLDLRILVIEQNGVPGVASRRTGNIGNSNADWVTAVERGFEGFRQVVVYNRMGSTIPQALVGTTFGDQEAAWRNPNLLPGIPDYNRLWGHIPWMGHVQPIIENLSTNRGLVINSNTFNAGTILGANPSAAGAANVNVGNGAGRRLDSIATWINDDSQGELRFWSRATHFLMDEQGTIVGLRYTTQTAETITINATSGLPDGMQPASGQRPITGIYNVRARYIIMATGTAGQNPEMLRRFSPPGTGGSVAHNFVMSWYGRLDGHGIQMLIDSGADVHPVWTNTNFWQNTPHPSLQSLPHYGPAFGDTEPALGNWNSLGGTSQLQSIFPTFLPRTIVVDATGQRVRGESNLAVQPLLWEQWPLWAITSSDPRHANTTFTRHPSAGDRAGTWNILDALEAAANSNAVGPWLGLSSSNSPVRARHSDFVKMADTLEELAAAIGIPAAQRPAFLAMVAEYDERVRRHFLGSGHADFVEWVDPITGPGRFAKPAEATVGSGAAAVNVCTLMRFHDSYGPFFAITVHGYGSEIAGGVVVNNRGQVLAPGGALLSGGNVYAVGGTANRQNWGQQYNAGMPQSATMGWAAGMHVLYQITDGAISFSPPGFTP